MKKFWKRLENGWIEKTGFKKGSFRILCAAILILIVGIVIEGVYLAIHPQNHEETEQDEEREGTFLSITTEDEPEDGETLEFSEIMEISDGEELTFAWPDKVKSNDIEAATESVNAAINALNAEGYSTGFILYDINTGGGISYRADETYYSASVIKGPFVAWLAQTYPDRVPDYLYMIEDTINYSSDIDYQNLMLTFGYDEFNAWMQEQGTSITIVDEFYPPITAREFNMLWQSMYQYFMSGDETAEMIRNLYADTINSCIAETLQGTYMTYTKAGWIGEGLGTYYHVQNDSGIVMKEDHPYILVVLSDAYERMDLLDNLVKSLDDAHSMLIG